VTFGEEKLELFVLGGVLTVILFYDNGYSL